MTVNIGINESKRTQIAKELGKLLADTYTVYLKTHKYHWNVTGPMFHLLHTTFEKQYNELALAVDGIAERIRMLGMRAPGSYQEFQELSSITDDPFVEASAMTMLESLLKDHEQIIRRAKDILPHLEGANDEGTLNLIGSRIEYHEKTAWMLRSSLS